MFRAVFSIHIIYILHFLEYFVYDISYCLCDVERKGDKVLGASENRIG